MESVEFGIAICSRHSLISLRLRPESPRGFLTGFQIQTETQISRPRRSESSAAHATAHDYICVGPSVLVCRDFYQVVKHSEQR